MAPDFALFLSPDGIALAHRQPAGHWAVLGDTALDVPDLGAELIRLRKLGEQRGGEGFATLLLLPDDQILYTSLTAPGPTEAIQRAQIEEGLDGLTPYAVDELTYDFHPLEDGRVKLAVVAKETLDEARAFAQEHSFNLAGFGARPLDAGYRGIAHFDRSLDWVADLEDIEFGPDLFHSGTSAADEEDAPTLDPADEDAPTSQDGEGDTAEADKAETAAPVEAEEDSPETAQPDAPDPGETGADDAPADEGDALEAADAAPDPDGSDETDGADKGETPPEDAATGFVSRRDHEETPKPEAGALVATRQARFGAGASGSEADGTDSEEAPKTGVRATRDTPIETSKGAAKKPRKPRAPKKAAKKPARPSAAGPEPGLSPLARVKKEVGRKPKADPGASDPPPERPSLAGPPPTPSSTGDDNSLRARLIAAGQRFTEAATLRRSRDSEDNQVESRQKLGALLSADAQARAASKETEDPAVDDSPANTSEPASDTPRPAAVARRRAQEVKGDDAPIMGGLLSRDSIAAQSGPSLRTGLVLTFVLIVILALVAIWSIFYLPNTALGRWMGLGEAEDNFTLAGSEPTISESAGSIGAAPAATDAPVEISALEPSDTPVPSPSVVAPELLPDIDADLDLIPLPVAPPMIDPETVLPSVEENESFYARTGVWQRPPLITLPQPAADLENLVFAGLDPVVASHDAILLQVPDFLPARDHPNPDAEPSPLANTLSLADLVEPSAEGTVAPYGTVVIAGAPELRPPFRPRELEVEEPVIELAAAEVPEAETETVTDAAIDTALLGSIRPQQRPSDLQEQRERFVLGGITFAELAEIQAPRRPESVQEQAASAAEAAANIADASEYAVVASLMPAARPSNIGDLVEQARAAGNSGPAGPVAASASDILQPDIPSSASVTRAATEENAINLRQINLIGVSGAPSERRALVRMPSGRFVTVEVGDRLDGGRVAAISESSLQYVKSGRTITLEVPTG